VNAALQAWRACIGAEHVVTDTAELARASTTTFATTHRVPAILRPANTAEVQACVRIANEHHVALYPVSRGRNYGLGSRVPSADGAALLDLSRMNRILAYDEQLAYLTVEPGVSFRQAAEFLAAEGGRRVISVIGGPADASVIGNLVERGDGIGPYGERLDNACDLEVVLPTGEVVHTGFSRFGAGLAATPVSRYTVGPYLDGLFTQSNLGIVTRATIALMARPAGFRYFSMGMTNTEALGTTIDRIRYLVLQDIVRPRSIYLWNSYKLQARDGRFPWGRTRTPLVLAELGETEPWYGFGALYTAHPELARMQGELIASALAGTAMVAFATEPSPISDFFLGTPADINLKSVYWRKTTDIPVDPDPDRDGCGVIWLCPVFPLDGACVVSAMKLAEDVIHAHGFEPNLGMCNGTGRTMLGFVAIVYDRAIPGEDGRAMACHDDLAARLIADGHALFRLGIQSMDTMPPMSDDSGRLLARIKRALDPNDVLAPGRYDFRGSWPA
jgi:4-cresol dehydrogenase (hydroxylating)